MAEERNAWVEPGTSTALCWLAIDDRKGNPTRPALPRALYADHIAPFLRFEKPLPNQLYVLGGRNRHGPLATVEMFDTWHGRWVSCPSMQKRRAGCSSAALPDGRLLVTGGYDQRGFVRGVLASCEIFEPCTQRWQSQCASMTRGRWGHGCASVGGIVYVVGGCSLRHGALPDAAFMETLRCCDIYDAGIDQWSSGPALSVARAGARLVALGDRHLAAVGGESDVFGFAESLFSVEVLDVSKRGSWTLLDARLCSPRATSAVAALDDERILVFGGAPSLESAELFDVQTVVRGSGVTRACFKPDDAECRPAVGLRPSSSSIEGRMGCQAALLKLPAPGSQYPDCNKKCVVVIGGERRHEEGSGIPVWQFCRALVYDVQSNVWRDPSTLPPMAVPRTAMAVCVASGWVSDPPRGLKRAHGDSDRQTSNKFPRVVFQENTDPLPLPIGLAPADSYS